MHNKGKYFESKTVEILKTLHPNKQVQPDVKIRGKLSNKLRQIDVLIEPSEYESLIFECKNHERPVDLDVFGVFTSTLEDLNKKGRAAMVSNSPYTAGVHNIAKAKGIDLLHVIDTNDPKISTKLFAPTLLCDTKIKSVQFGYQTYANFSGIRPASLTIIGPHFTGSSKDYLCHLWDNTELLKETPGEFEFLLENANIITTDGSEVPFKVTFRYTVEEEYYSGELGILNSQGVYNTRTGTYQTRSLETEPLVAHEVEKTWQKISLDQANQLEYAIKQSCKSLFKGPI